MLRIYQLIVVAILPIMTMTQCYILPRCPLQVERQQPRWRPFCFNGPQLGNLLGGLPSLVLLLALACATRSRHSSVLRSQHPPARSIAAAARRRPHPPLCYYNPSARLPAPALRHEWVVSDPQRRKGIALEQRVPLDLPRRAAGAAPKLLTLLAQFDIAALERADLLLDLGIWRVNGPVSPTSAAVLCVSSSAVGR
jgi:hypothetical protein